MKKAGKKKGKGMDLFGNGSRIVSSGKQKDAEDLSSSEAEIDCMSEGDAAYDEKVTSVEKLF